MKISIMTKNWLNICITIAAKMSLFTILKMPMNLQMSQVDEMFQIDIYQLCFCPDERHIYVTHLCISETLTSLRCTV